MKQFFEKYLPDPENTDDLLIVRGLMDKKVEVKIRLPDESITGGWIISEIPYTVSGFVKLSNGKMSSRVPFSVFYELNDTLIESYRK